MDDSTTKRCTKCGEQKPLAEFHKNRKERDGYARWCKACYKAHMSAPEQRQRKSEYDRQRLETKGDEIRAKARQRYATDEAHREKHIAYEREKRQRGAYREYDRQRHYERWSKPEFRKAKIAAFRKRRHTDDAYRLYLRQWSRQRYARVRAEYFSYDEWDALCKRYDYRCLCCGEHKPLTIDHVKPLSKGGTNTIDNVQPLCLDCNRRKHARTIDYRY